MTMYYGLTVPNGIRESTDHVYTHSMMSHESDGTHDLMWHWTYESNRPDLDSTIGRPTLKWHDAPRDSTLLTSDLKVDVAASRTHALAFRRHRQNRGTLIIWNTIPEPFEPMAGGNWPLNHKAVLNNEYVEIPWLFTVQLMQYGLAQLRLERPRANLPPILFQPRPDRYMVIRYRNNLTVVRVSTLTKKATELESLHCAQWITSLRTCSLPITLCIPRATVR